MTFEELYEKIFKVTQMYPYWGWIIDYAEKISIDRNYGCPIKFNDRESAIKYILNVAKDDKTGENWKKIETLYNMLDEHSKLSRSIRENYL